MGPGACTSGPHDPFVVPEPFVRRYDPAEIPLPPSFRDDLTDKPGDYRRLRQQVWGQLSEQEVRESIAHEWAYCTREDTYFGLLVDALEVSGQRENTLVLKLSDHGEYVLRARVPATPESSARHVSRRRRAARRDRSRSAIVRWKAWAIRGPASPPRRFRHGAAS